MFANIIGTKQVAFGLLYIGAKVKVKVKVTSFPDGVTENQIQCSH